MKRRQKINSSAKINQNSSSFAVNTTKFLNSLKALELVFLAIDSFELIDQNVTLNLAGKDTLYENSM